MELPHIGKHCSQEYCRQLDFLPVKCDACSKVFCGEHYSYAGHNCPGAYRKNVQVPVCPLCSAPVPGKVDELPDIRVSRHIDADCKSDTAITRRNKVYTNKCSHKGCKQKEMIPILCDSCNLNYCLKHRHTADHNCEHTSGKPLNKAAQAAMSRSKSSGSNNIPSRSSNAQAARNSIGATASNFSSGLSRFLGYGQTPTTPASVQGNMTEDEALQLALQASLADSGAHSVATNSNSARNTSQEQEDFLLAKAIAESEREANSAAGRQSRNRQPNCKVS